MKRDLKQYPTNAWSSRDPRRMSVALFLRIDLRYMDKEDLLDLLFWDSGCDMPADYVDTGRRTLLKITRDIRNYYESIL